MRVSRFLTRAAAAAAGELYHQYHDDMVEKYGDAYKALRQPALARGTLAVSPCPGDQGLAL